MGHELVPAEAARVSYGKRTKGREKDLNLIRFLLQLDHGSPFEHVVFTFRVLAPIFVLRQVMRHRIGFSYNEKSLRYTTSTDDFFVPTRVDDESSRVIEDAYDAAWNAYSILLSRGVPREIARTVLPLGTMTEVYITANLRALMHFWVLRLSEHAQEETRELARGMLELVRRSGFGEVIELFESEVLDRVCFGGREQKALSIDMQDGEYNLTDGELERLRDKLKVVGKAPSS